MIRHSLRYWIKNFILVHVASLLIILPVFHDLVSHPLRIKETGELIDVPPGATVKTLADRLHAQGIIRHPRVLEWYTRLTLQDRQLRAGEYFIPAHTTLVELISLLRSGMVFMRQIQFIEGITARQMIQSIQANPYIKHTINFNDPSWFRQLSKRYDNPEGLLMPDTYLFAKWETDAAIITRAYRIMQSTLDLAWANRASDLPYTDPYAALIAASIIEKETAVTSERAQVSGVIARRLEHHMKLQMDPTVIYALGESFNGDLTRADLSYKSPYNTYVNFGLPPTPICLPSRASIMAAVSPAPGNSLYFVAIGDGSHHFSDTLQEHNKAVVKYAIPALKKELTWPQKKGQTSSSP